MLLTKKILFLFIFISAGLSAQHSDTLITKRKNYQSDNKKETPLDTLVDKMMVNFMQSPQNCGISIGISHEGRTYFYNYGETKRGSKNLPTVNTIYEIGSITATYCGILLAQAVTDHKVTLEDDIRTYLPGKYPDLEFNDAPILLKHLANHTSGLPNVPENLKSQPGFDSLNPYKTYDEENIYGYLKIVRPSTDPGSVSNYSNLGMAVLGLILETIYNKPFEDLVREKICMPNRLNNTVFQLTADQQSLSASGYNQEGKATPAWDLGAFKAAGGLKSTSSDMLAYLDMSLYDRSEPARLAQVPAFKERQTLGLAWFIKKTKQNNTLIWHNGATYGFSSFGGFLKEKKCSVIILANSATNVEYIGIAILNHFQQ